MKKNEKSGKIGFDLNRVATAATDIWAYGLDAQSRRASGKKKNTPYYKFKKKLKFAYWLAYWLAYCLLPIAYCLLPIG